MLACTSATSALRPASSNRFSYDRLKCFAMQAQLHYQQVQSPVFIFQRFEPLSLAHVHVAELLLSVVERRCADTVLPAQVRGLHPSLTCFNNRMICSSVYRPFFILRPLQQFTRELQIQLVEFLGDTSDSDRYTMRIHDLMHIGIYLHMSAHLQIVACDPNAQG